MNEACSWICCCEFFGREGVHRGGVVQAASKTVIFFQCEIVKEYVVFLSSGQDGNDTGETAGFGGLGELRKEVESKAHAGIVM